MSRRLKWASKYAGRLPRTTTSRGIQRFVSYFAMFSIYILELHKKKKKEKNKTKKVGDVYETMVFYTRKYHLLFQFLRRSIRWPLRQSINTVVQADKLVILMLTSHTPILPYLPLHIYLTLHPFISLSHSLMIVRASSQALKMRWRNTLLVFRSLHLHTISYPHSSLNLSTRLTLTLSLL